MLAEVTCCSETQPLDLILKVDTLSFQKKTSANSLDCNGSTVLLMRHGLRLFSCTSLGNLLPNQSLRCSWLLLISLWEATNDCFTKKEKSSNCFLCTCESGPPWKHPLIFIWLQKMSTKIPPKIDLRHTREINVKTSSTWIVDPVHPRHPTRAHVVFILVELHFRGSVLPLTSLPFRLGWSEMVKLTKFLQFSSETPDWMNLNESFQTCFGV